MNIIFGTTNKRKVKDLQTVVDKLKLDIKVLSMEDINWDRGEIEETGRTIEENSFIKANAILEFCKDHNIDYPIITDDSGLFVDALYGEPGVYTARYADEERKENPELPEYQCVNKLLDRLNGMENRNACYRSCVTAMMPDGSYNQFYGESNGTISKEIIGDLSKPFFYSVFVLNGTNVAFNKLEEKDLDDTYRFKALKKTFSYLSNKYVCK
ncbi:MAG: non-canonical purine NTP pyrophosphatase [Bacilli bacterium]|nr:non-canonical purine NTP pyrophosphatase [Bacilli bacterium]